MNIGRIRNLITPAEVRKERRLGKLCRELDLPFVQAFYQVEVFGPDGKLLDGMRSRSHSWTRNAYNHIFSQLAGKDATSSTFGAGLLSGKNTSGTVRYGSYTISISKDLSADGTDYGYRAPAGEASYGIVVGSGINAESLEDYALQTPIANGTGAGQLSYVQSEAHVITWSSPTFKNTLVRHFNNNSGGDVSVNEIALIARMFPAVLSYNSVLQARDKLASTVTVPNTGQLKVTYEITLTYP